MSGNTDTRTKRVAKTVFWLVLFAILTWWLRVQKQHIFAYTDRASGTAWVGYGSLGLAVLIVQAFFRQALGWPTRAALILSAWLFYAMTLYHDFRIWESTTDTVMGLYSIRQYFRGDVAWPNFWSMIDLSDISKSHPFWNYWWAPSMSYLPLPFLRAIANPWVALDFMLHLSLVAAWIFFSKLLVKHRAGAGALLAFGAAFTTVLVHKTALRMYWADTLVLWMLPAALLLYFRIFESLENRRGGRAQLGAVALGLFTGLYYPMKFSALFTGAGVLAFAAGHLALNSSAKWRHRLVVVAIAGVSFVGVFGLFSWLNLKYTGQVTATSQWIAHTPDTGGPVFWRAVVENYLTLPLRYLLSPNPEYNAYSTPLKSWIGVWITLAFVMIFLTRRGRTEKLNILNAILTLVMIPAITFVYMCYKTDKADIFAVPRYGFSFVLAMPFIAVSAMTCSHFFNGRGDQKARTRLWARVLVGLGLLLIFLQPGLHATRQVAKSLWEQIGKSAKSSRDVVYHNFPGDNPVTRKAVNWVNTLSPDTVVFLSVSDIAMPMIYEIDRRLVLTSFPSALIGPVAIPYYLNHGMGDLVSGARAVEYRSSKATPVALVISSFMMEPHKIRENIPRIFPQIKNWEVEQDGPDVYLARGVIDPKL